MLNEKVGTTNISRLASTGEVFGRLMSTLETLGMLVTLNAHNIDVAIAREDERAVSILTRDGNDLLNLIAATRTALVAYEHNRRN